MLENLIKAVTDWPVVIQGALGSALFAVFMYTGQKLTQASTTWMRSRSKELRKSALLETLIRLQAVQATDSVEQAKYAAILVYRALRHVTKGLIWLTLGLTLGSVISVLGIVGFIGCLFYLFKGLAILAPTYLEPNVEQKIAEIQAELAQLE